jgi:hypothetical protein
LLFEINLKTRKGALIAMLKKHMFFWILPIALLLVVGLYFSGCSEQPDQITAPQASDRDTIMVQIEYFGSESSESLSQRIDSLNAQISDPALKLDREAILTSFQTEKRQQLPLATSAYYTAYTSHFVTQGDKDLYLEYKWWTGGTRQAYQMTTFDYTIYWIVKVKYGGRLTSWTWMEGSYQRVTAIAGAALWIPFPDSYLRAAIRVYAS